MVRIVGERDGSMRKADRWEQQEERDECLHGGWFELRRDRRADGRLWSDGGGVEIRA